MELKAPNMSDYYKIRKEIHKLYDNDVQMTGDICSRVLEIRDKDKSVEYIKVALKDYSIDIELAEGTTEETKKKVVDKIANRIGVFISSNQDKLNIENKDEFNNMMESESFSFCDISSVGNSIKFNL